MPIGCDGGGGDHTWAVLVGWVHDHLFKVRTRARISVHHGGLIVHWRDTCSRRGRLRRLFALSLSIGPQCPSVAAALSRSRTRGDKGGIPVDLPTPALRHRQDIQSGVGDHQPAANLRAGFAGPVRARGDRRARATSDGGRRKDSRDADADQTASAAASPRHRRSLGQGESASRSRGLSGCDDRTAE